MIGQARFSIDCRCLDYVCASEESSGLEGASRIAFYLKVHRVETSDSFSSPALSQQHYCEGTFAKVVAYLHLPLIGGILIFSVLFRDHNGRLDIPHKSFQL